MSLAAVVFDFDGLILDTERVEFEVWQRIFRENGAELDYGPWSKSIGAWDAFDPVAHLEGIVGGKLDGGALKDRFRSLGREALDGMDVLPGVREKLREAAAEGLRIAIASSSRRDWVEGHLRSRGLLSAFEVISCGGNGVRAKPDPDTYEGALRALSVGAGEAAAVEDSPNGVAAAKAAGLYCIAVPNSVTRGLDLSAADRLADDLNGFTFAELKALFAAGKAAA